MDTNPMTADSKSASIISSEIESLDVASPGPYSLAFQGDYDFGNNDGVPDAKVRAGAVTDVRGRLFVPDGEGPFPIAVFLHGNHSTCRSETPAGDWWADQSVVSPFADNCPDGFIEAPSYAGYDYLGEHLASHGYVVASINANYGINDTGGEPDDPGLILARGRLILKHLAFFRKLNDGFMPVHGDYPANGDLPPDVLLGKLNFKHVGIMGHSRGGEGARAAHYLLVSNDPMSYAADLTNIFIENDPNTTEDDETINTTIEGIFEFAPVDLMVPDEDAPGSRLLLDALGVHRAVVIGTCDNDVNTYAGVGPFSRRRMEDTTSRTFSSVLAVPGANHYYFNTEWTTFDGNASTACPAGYPYLWVDDWTNVDKFSNGGGSPIQKGIGLITLSAFFRGFVGSQADRRDFQRVFDPQYYPPEQLAALTDPIRESLWHQSTELHTASMAGQSSNVDSVDYAEQVGSITTGMERELTRIDWSSDPSEGFFEVDLFEGGRNMEDAWIISFSVARYQEDDSYDGPDPLDFGVQLVFEDGAVSAPVRILDYVKVARGTNELTPCSEGGGVEITPGTCIDDDDNTWQRQSRFLLFFEVPIELRDFDIADGVEDGNIYDQNATGLRFTFDPDSAGQIFLDKMTVLRKHPLLGDVDETWTVDIVDALIVSQHYVGLEVTPYFNPDQADVDCNGTIDIVDALLIAQYYVGSLEAFPCQTAQ